MDVEARRSIVVFLFGTGIIISVLAGLIAGGRMLVLWYWRVNEALTQLDAINANLRAIYTELREQGAQRSAKVG